MARIAGITLKRTDCLVEQLGDPIGIQSYKPFHFAGDDFLQNYLGMIGLPMDMQPIFPNDRQIVLLTAQAAGDPSIMNNIKQQLLSGKEVVITSGLLKAIPEKIAEIAELRCTDLKALVNDFGKHGKSTHNLLIPQVLYYTNDAWEMVSAGQPLTRGVSGYPIVLRAPYASGNLYVLTIPDDMGKLYDYPIGALNEIRRILSKGLDAYIEGPSKVALFLYDNQTLVVENFNDEPVDINIVMNEKIDKLTSLDRNGKAVQPQLAKFNSFPHNKQPLRHSFQITLMPHSYKAYKY